MTSSNDPEPHLPGKAPMDMPYQVLERNETSRNPIVVLFRAFWPRRAPHE